MNINKILKNQEELQKAFGFPIDDQDIATKVNLLHQYSVGAIKEISEIMDEFSWKPWASDIFLNKGSIISEVADTFLFLMNILLAVDGNAESFEKAVKAKMQKNFARAGIDYRHDSFKCIECKRALDDFYPLETIFSDKITLCPECTVRVA